MDSVVYLDFMTAAMAVFLVSFYTAYSVLWEKHIRCSEGLACRYPAAWPGPTLTETQQGLYV